MMAAVGAGAGASAVAGLEDGCLVLPTPMPIQPQYKLRELLPGMKPGDMPGAPGWQGAQPVGKEAL
jgi:hypothetical protein